MYKYISIIVLWLVLATPAYADNWVSQSVDKAQTVVIQLDWLANEIHKVCKQEGMWDFMPVDDFRIYIQRKEVGIEWTF